MLVSMECLIGAAYTRAAEAAGLTGDVRPVHGPRRRPVRRLAHRRLLARRAQLWIDRNFALDYTLKSLEKGPRRRPAPRQRPRARAWSSRTPPTTSSADMLALLDRTDHDAAGP